MALVSYDYDSNSSESEDEKVDSSCVLVTKTITNLEPNFEPESEHKSEILTPQIGDTDSINDLQNSEENNIFLKLPKTKTKSVSIKEDQIEDFIPKVNPEVKQKPKVKITIPSLSQFDNDDDSDELQVKKLKPSPKGSGLISLLPPVKGTVMTTKSFVPHVVTNKKTTNATAAKTLVPHAVRKKAEAKKAAFLKAQRNTAQLSLSDAESGDDIDIPDTYDDDMWEKVCGKPKPKPNLQESEPEVQSHPDYIDIAPEPEEPYEGLDNQAFKELVGKTKRPIGNIKLIDINEEDILSDKDLWMTKSLTDPEMAPKAKIEDPVDPTKRKKHHITYLAQQAKANEQELQNSWAASKNNRMATRAKYGF